MLAYLTPNNPPGQCVIVRAVCLPSDAEYLALVGGALSELANAANYESFGSQSPDDTAAFFQGVLDQFYEASMYVSLGMIIPFATSSLPAWVLPCTGGTYLRVDYPALYAVLDASLIVDADSFNTPDLRDRYVVGAGGGVSTGGQVGANSVSLTAAQNGPHTHTYVPPVSNVDLETPGAPDIFAAGIGVPVQTGSSGNGQAHENRPASTGLLYGMVAYG
jgi:hypothetical protein